ncbi:MAG: hypothetical protein AAF380_02995 [Bacteroidota bacterium]
MMTNSSFFKSCLFFNFTLLATCLGTQQSHTLKPKPKTNASRNPKQLIKNRFPQTATAYSKNPDIDYNLFHFYHKKRKQRAVRTIGSKTSFWYVDQVDNETTFTLHNNQEIKGQDLIKAIGQNLTYEPPKEKGEKKDRYVIPGSFIEKVNCKTSTFVLEQPENFSRLTLIIFSSPKNKEVDFFCILPRPTSCAITIDKQKGKKLELSYRRDSRQKEALIAWWEYAVHMENLFKLYIALTQEAKKNQALQSAATLIKNYITHSKKLRILYPKYTDYNTSLKNAFYKDDQKVSKEDTFAITFEKDKKQNTVIKQEAWHKKSGYQRDHIELKTDFLTYPNPDPKALPMPRMLSIPKKKPINMLDTITEGIELDETSSEYDSEDDANMASMLDADTLTALDKKAPTPPTQVQDIQPLRNNATGAQDDTDRSETAQVHTPASQTTSAHQPPTPPTQVQDIQPPTSSELPHKDHHSKAGTPKADTPAQQATSTHQPPTPPEKVKNKNPDTNTHQHKPKNASKVETTQVHTPAQQTTSTHQPPTPPTQVEGIQPHKPKNVNKVETPKVHTPAQQTTSTHQPPTPPTQVEGIQPHKPKNASKIEAPNVHIPRAEKKQEEESLSMHAIQTCIAVLVGIGILSVLYKYTRSKSQQKRKGAKPSKKSKGLKNRHKRKKTK